VSMGGKRALLEGDIGIASLLTFQEKEYGDPSVQERRGYK